MTLRYSLVTELGAEVMQQQLLIGACTSCRDGMRGRTSFTEGTGSARYSLLNDAGSGQV